MNPFHWFIAQSKHAHQLHVQFITSSHRSLSFFSLFFFAPVFVFATMMMMMIFNRTRILVSRCSYCIIHRSPMNFYILFCHALRNKNKFLNGLIFHSHFLNGISLWGRGMRPSPSWFLAVRHSYIIHRTFCSDLKLNFTGLHQMVRPHNDTEKAKCTFPSDHIYFLGAVCGSIPFGS